MDRDCANCIWSSPWCGEGNGCSRWSCEFINKQEAAEAWREKYQKEDVKSLEE